MSPVTQALWASLPFPPCAPVSTSFFAERCNQVQVIEFFTDEKKDLATRTCMHARTQETYSHIYTLVSARPQTTSQTNQPTTICAVCNLPLSHAPPALFRKRDIKIPVTVANTRTDNTARAPRSPSDSVEKDSTRLKRRPTHI